MSVKNKINSINLWLKKNTSLDTHILSIKKFETGQSNPTFLLKSDNKSFVLRSKPLGNLLRGAHRIDREYKVMGALSNSKIPRIFNFPLWFPTPENMKLNKFSYIQSNPFTSIGIDSDETNPVDIEYIRNGTSFLIFKPLRIIFRAFYIFFVKINSYDGFKSVINT